MADAPPPALVPKIELEEALSLLTRDLSKLSLHLRNLDHTLTTECDALTLRLHYPAFRQGKPMVAELINAVSMHIVHFCLPRKDVKAVLDLYGSVDVEEFSQRFEALRQEAYDLFKRAHIATNRNGEAGELILYLLTEWLLGAPQIIAKMSLKTNTEMPVHGADGVHARYCPDTGRLFVYWGEAKLYQDIGKAIAEAVDSIAESLKDEKVKHEITLVKRYLDFSGLNEPAKKAMLGILDPFSPGYANRHDVISCLIAFDFDAFEAAQGAKDAEEEFCKLAHAKLAEVAPKIAGTLKNKGMVHQPVEMFIVPVPSVGRLRELFQDKIGWKQPPPPKLKKAPSKKRSPAGVSGGGS
ncbi:MAG: DUF1837 domain-containing protein [Bacteroidales bacterium]|nr:DUF1837 domain-containing protein [Bacteroidales bacterium]